VGGGVSPARAPPVLPVPGPQPVMAKATASGAAARHQQILLMNL
jgi:hypothetical protein